MKKRLVKDDIVDAFFELLKRNDVQEITITDIINKAGVCRASFYRNFYSIEEIVRYYLFNIAESCNISFPLNKDNVYSHTYHSFELIKEEKDRLLLLNKRDLLYIYDDIAYELTKKQMEVLDNAKNSYSPYAVAGSTSFVIRAWINNNFQDDIEDVISSLF